MRVKGKSSEMEKGLTHLTDLPILLLRIKEL